MPVIRYSASVSFLNLVKEKDELVSDRNSSTFAISGLNINKSNRIQEGIQKWIIQ
jgi:hypothetical protein